MKITEKENNRKIKRNLSHQLEAENAICSDETVNVIKGAKMNDMQSVRLAAIRNEKSHNKPTHLFGANTRCPTDELTLEIPLAN